MRMNERLDQVASFLETVRDKNEIVEGDFYDFCASAVRSAADTYYLELRRRRERTDSTALDNLILQVQGLLKHRDIASGRLGMFDEYYMQEVSDDRLSFPDVSLGQLLSLGDQEFEEFVAYLLRKMGFSARAAKLKHQVRLINGRYLILLAREYGQSDDETAQDNGQQKLGRE